MFADCVKVAKGGEHGEEPKEMKKVNLKGPFVPFVSLFATQVWQKKESLSMPVGMAEAEGSGTVVALVLGWFTMVIGTFYVQAL